MQQKKKAVGNSSAIGSVEVRVVHSHLGEICVRGTAKRVWKNEMQKYACGRHMAFTSCCVALVVLWMGLHQEKFPLLATTLQAAAGVSGSQRWALILPSSARVSLVTYTAVIAVRYPELDNVQNDLVCFGNYLLGEQATSGGFLPLFWDCPAQSKQNGRHLWRLRVGHPIRWCGSVQERYILCRHDCPLRSPGTDKGRISQWW